MKWWLEVIEWENYIDFVVQRKIFQEYKIHNEWQVFKHNFSVLIIIKIILWMKDKQGESKSRFVNNIKYFLSWKVFHLNQPFKNEFEEWKKL